MGRMQATCKEYDMGALFNHLGYAIKKRGSAKMVCCPFHSDKKPSAEIRPGNLLYCHACGEKGDNIKVHMTLQGCGFRDSVNAINALQSHAPTLKKIAGQKEKVDYTPPSAPETDLEKEEQQKKRYQVFLSQFKEYSILSQNQREIVDSYLKERCLTGAIEVLEANKCRIGLFWDKIDNKFYIAWWLKSWGIVVKDYKQNMGKPTPTCLKINSSNVWMLCEGITDALSAAKMGYNAISLNSVNQLDRFIQILSENENAKNQEFMIAFDNDEAGVKARLKLLNFFMKNNYKYSIYKELVVNNDTCKDLNEYYISLVSACL